MTEMLRQMDPLELSLVEEKGTSLLKLAQHPHQNRSQKNLLMHVQLQLQT
jgi:hypothetical protein